jgi:hypothetical protein
MGNSPWKDGKVPLGAISGRAHAAQKARRKSSAVQRHKKESGCPLTAVALLAGGAALIGSAGYTTVHLIWFVLS